MPTEVFYTPLSSDQVMKSLRAEVDAPLGWVSGNGFFFGKLSDDSFQIRPKLWYRGIYPPQFDGQLKSCATYGSCLQLKYPESSGWQISAGFIGLLLGSMLVNELRRKVINWDNVFGAIGISAFFALVLWGTQILFRYEVKKAKAFLVTLLQLGEKPGDK